MAGQRTPVRGAGLAAALLAIAVVSGCAGGDGGGAAEPKKPTSLDEVLGLDAKSIAEGHRKRQELVARCMKKQGFDYVVTNAQLVEHITLPEPGTAKDKALRKKRGYGITTGVAVVHVPPNHDSDPNAKIRDSLSPKEQEAYDKALFGDAHEGVVSSRGSDRGDVTKGLDQGSVSGAGEGMFGGGCFQEGEKLARPRHEISQEDFREMNDRVRADPRLIHANRAWAACMTGRGLSFESPDDIQDYLLRKMGIDDSSTQGEVQEPVVERERPDGAQLAELQREEIRLALADYDCLRKTKRQEVFERVQKEVERRYLDQHPNLGK